MTGQAWSLAVFGLLLAAGLLALAPAEGQAAQTAWHEAKNGAPLRSFRVTLEVPAPVGAQVRNIPVQATLDLAEILATKAAFPSRSSGVTQNVALQGFELDLSSFTLWESSATPARRLPVLVSPSGPDFDASTHPEVTARWVLDGETSATRTFQLYFDAKHSANTAESAAAVDHGLLSVLASSIGPGRGNRIFVPLHDLPVPQGPASEQRRVWITNLFGGDNQLKVYEYRFGMPAPEPIAHHTLSGVGDTYVYVLGNFGQKRSEGGVYIEAEQPIVAEARSAPDSFKANLFVPSADGGYVGRSFILSNPGPAQAWTVFCPSILAGTLPTGNLGCRVTTGGTPQDISADATLTLPMVAAQTSWLQATIGQIAVQRLGAGLVAWPALDGPFSAALAEGVAGSQDTLVLSSRGDGACLLVQSRVGARPLLTGTGGGRTLCLEAGTLSEPSAGSWASSWARHWEIADKSHAGGPARITEWQGTGGVSVVSGAIPHPTTFSALVAPQTFDGGFETLVHIPAPHSEPTLVLGDLVIFALFNGTAVEAIHLESGLHIPVGPLLARQRVDLGAAELGRGGTWSIQADRPVLAAWLKPGSAPFAGPALAFTEGGTVHVAAAQYIGSALHVVAAQPVVQASPGGQVEFLVKIQNLGRDLAAGVADDITLDVSGHPAGWRDATVVPRVLSLGAGETDNVTVTLDVPATADVSKGGVSLTLRVRSGNNPSFTVEESLRVNYVVKRGVDVKAAGQDVEARQEIAANEAALYPVVITNRGSAVDNYTIAISPLPAGSVWRYELPPDLQDYTGWTGPMEAGQSMRFDIRVAPAREGVASSQITNVFVRSTSDGSVFDSVRILTVVGVERSFRVEADAPDKTASPGETVRFEVRIHNDADANEELQIEVVSHAPNGTWPAPGVFWLRDSGEQVALATVNSTIAVPPRSNTTLLVVRQVPGDATPLAIAQDNLRFRSTAMRESAGTDLPLRVVVSRVDGFKALVTPATPVARPASALEIDLALSSTGNTEQALQVFAVLPSLGGPWTLQSEGAPGPWNLTLHPGSEAKLRFTLDVPGDAPPRREAPSVLGLVLTSQGTPASVIPIILDVQEHPALSVEARRLNLSVGWTHPIEVQVRNVGNVPVQAQAVFEDPIPGWSIAAGEGLVPVRGTARLQVNVSVPLDASGERAATLNVLDVGAGRVLASSPWTLHVGTPVLDAQPLTSASVPDGRVYRVRVVNTGDAAAHNVTLTLLVDGTPVDRFAIGQVLAGGSHVATLVGPAGGEAEVLLAAAHQPEGRTLAAAEDAQPSPKSLPSPPTLMLAGAALGLAALLRRRPA